jgi:hypothetical protein
VTDRSIAAGGRLGPGSVLARSYAILLGNLSSFFAVALATTALGFVCSEVWLSYGPGVSVGADEAPFSLAALILPPLIVESVLASLATGIIVYGTLRELQGQSAGLREIFRRSLPVLGPVVLLGLVATLATLAGLALLVVPGLILGVWLWIAVPVMVVERCGVRASLARSRDLTAGSRWPIFALLLLSLATFGGFAFGVAYVVDYETAFWRSLASELGGTSLLVAFWAVVSAVSYVDLKRIKEGSGVDEIAAVFD